jgi:1L-myo-inositol 1-phosphate cytidylyltransferase
MITQAVILAAGRGSRLAANDQNPEEFSKPLLEVGGSSLLGHSLCACAEAGVERAFIVTGYRAEAVRAEMDRWPMLDTVEVYNPEWALPNGLSVAASARVVDGDFLLLMADHLFDSSILADLAAGSWSGDVTLAVDARVDAVIDLEDATKVRRDGDRIVSIGKTIDDFDAVDCGLFRCTPAIFDALEQAALTRPPSLSDGLRQLIRSGSFLAMEIEERWWQDVDTPEMAVNAARELSRRRGTGEAAG